MITEHHSPEPRRREPGKPLAAEGEEAVDALLAQLDDAGYQATNDRRFWWGWLNDELDHRPFRWVVLAMIAAACAGAAFGYLASV